MSLEERGAIRRKGLLRREFLRATTAATAGLVVSGCAKAAKQAASTEENKALVRRYVDMWNTDNRNLVDEIVAPDFVNHPGTTRGRSGHRQWMAGVQALWPDLEMNIELMLAEGDMVAYWWTANPSTEGTLFGIPPTGRQIRLSAIKIVRIADGMIAESWQEWNTFDVYQQLGGVSSQGTSGG